MTRTLNQVARLADVTVLDHLDAQVDVPALGGPAPQGDVTVIPADGRRIITRPLGPPGEDGTVPRTADITLPDGRSWTETWPATSVKYVDSDVTYPVIASAATLLPACGVPVVRGENGGNTHLLIGDGPVLFDGGEGGTQTLGTLTVSTGSTAYLIHPEHGAAGIAPGTYVIRRQREQADEVRLVAD